MASKQNEKHLFRSAPFTNDIKSPNDTGYEPESSHTSQFHPMKLPTAPSSGSNPSKLLPNLGENRLAPSVAEFDTISLGAVNLQRSPEPPVVSSVMPVMSRAGTAEEKSLRGSRHPNWLKNRRMQVAAALCVVILLGLVGFSLWHFLLGGIPNVTLYRVSMKNVDLQVGGGGLAYPVQSLDISYPFSARVLSVFVKPGDRVRLNQSLVQMDLSQVNAQNITQLNAQVEQAYQDLLAAQAYLNTVLGVGNPVDIAQARQQYYAALSKYQALQAEANAPSLHEGILTSTMSGVVTVVNVYPGQELSANKIILTIFDESSIIVRAQLPLTNYGQVHINQAAQVVPSALPDQNYNGTVVSIIPSADSQSGTFEVWVEVANTTGTLLPGMSTFVNIQNPIRALVVPRLAVLNPDQDSIVFVVRQQHAYIQHVQVSGYTGDSVIIGEGLNANDTIVLVGLDSLQDGQLVHVRGTES